jgi:hypothetical protein
VTLEELRGYDGVCVELRVGREVWLATLAVGKEARLMDFRPTNEDPFETAPSSPMVVDERLLSALRVDGRDRLIVEARWLLVFRDDTCPS